MHSSFSLPPLRSMCIFAAFGNYVINRQPLRSINLFNSYLEIATFDKHVNRFLSIAPICLRFTQGKYSPTFYFDRNYEYLPNENIFRLHLWLGVIAIYHGCLWSFTSSCTEITSMLISKNNGSFYRIVRSQNNLVALLWICTSENLCTMNIRQWCLGEKLMIWSHNALFVNKYRINILSQTNWQYRHLPDRNHLIL